MKIINQIFIDLTSKFCVFALYQNNILKDQQIKETKNNLTDLAILELEVLFERNQITYGDIQEIYVNSGPGSFTGVRVGMIIAKTIVQLIPSIQLYHLDTLRICQQFEKDTFCYLDAKGGKFYVLNDNQEYIIYSREELNAILQTKLSYFDTTYINYSSLLPKLDLNTFIKTSLKELSANYVKQHIS